MGSGRQVFQGGQIKDAPILQGMGSAAFAGARMAGEGVNLSGLAQGVGAAANNLMASKRQADAKAEAEAKRLKELNDRKELALAVSDFNLKQVELDTQETVNLQSTDGEGFTKRQLGNRRALAENVATSLSPDVREAFNLHIIEREASDFAQYAKLEQKQKTGWEVNDLTNFGSEVQKAAYADPNFENTVKRIEALNSRVDGAKYLQIDDKNKVKVKGSIDTFKAYSDGFIRKIVEDETLDKPTQLEQIDSMKKNISDLLPNYLPPDATEDIKKEWDSYANNLQKGIEKERENAIKLFEAQNDSRQDGLLAQAETGNPDARKELEQHLSFLKQQNTPESIRKAGKLEQSINKAIIGSEAEKLIKAGDFAGANALYEREKNLTQSDVANAAVHKANADKLQEKLKDWATMANSDPSKFINNLDDIQTIDSHGDLNASVQERIKESARWGVSPYRQKLAPEFFKNQIKDLLKSGDANTILQESNKLFAQTNPQTKQVLIRELVQDKTIPQEYAFALAYSNDSAVSTNLLDANKNYKDNKKALLDDAKDYNNFTKKIAQTKEISSLSRALTAANNSEMANALNVATTSLAMKYMTKGESADQAIKHASQDLTKQYKSFSVNGKPLFIYDPEQKMSSSEVSQNVSSVFKSAATLRQALGMNNQTSLASSGNFITKPNTQARQYESLARQKAKQYGIPEDLFARQINQESGYNPKAGSSAGAQGIAQIIPATAKAWGVKNVFDPNEALDAAAKNMAGYWKTYKKQGKSDLEAYKLSLAAYNAGPGSVDKYKGIPPFAETQNYVKSITNGQTIAPNKDELSWMVQTGRAVPTQSGKGFYVEYPDRQRPSSFRLATDTNGKPIEIPYNKKFVEAKPKPIPMQATGENIKVDSNLAATLFGKGGL